MQKHILYFFLFALITSCGSEEEKQTIQEVKKDDKVVVEKITTPTFNADSAYQFVQTQVDFGPRIPNTPKHDSCGNWMKRKLKEYGFELTVQNGSAKAWTGEMLRIENIMGQFNPEESNRIMLCAHWDTRPYADRDTKDETKPILGANDGGSGVGVLLEVARQISIANPNTGVDIIFFDAEDYGAPSATGMADISTMSDTWCLGSQYWSKNIPFENYNPRYGILLDMVGAADAEFYKEGISRQYAAQSVNRIWNEAAKLGFSKYFVKKLAPPITDDHTYINKIAGIPTLDIVHYAPNASYGNFDFGPFHHTHDDNMDIISKETLNAVGQTLLHVIYQKI